MNNQEAIKNLERLKEYFESPVFENNRVVINALEIAIKAIENKEDSENLIKLLLIE